MAKTDEIPQSHDAGLLRWTVSERDDGVVVAFRGELDLATAQTLTDLLVDLALAKPCKVVCDLAQVSFLDSTGIRAILTAATAASEAGSAVVVRDPIPSVRRVLEICGLDAVLLDDPCGDASLRR